MSPKQLVMLNKGVLSSENQVVTPGMELNVTYYTSPLTIEVTKEKLSQQYIVPEVPEYIEDDSLEIRPNFYHDIDRIIYSLSFLRYQKKTPKSKATR